MRLEPCPQHPSAHATAPSSSKRIASVAWLVAASLWSGCGSEPVVKWRVQFACEEPTDRVAAVQTRILQGGCDGTEIYVARVDKSDVQAPASPGVLDRGNYGFEAVALGSDGRTVARLCRETSLPTTETLELVLADGACSDPVAGDGGSTPAQDGGPPDCGTPVECGVCADSVSFVDTMGYSCEEWRGYDCLSVEQMFDYTSEEGEALRDNCPRACALCAAP